MTPKSLQEPDVAKAAAAHPDRELLDLSAALAAAHDVFDRTSPAADAEAEAEAEAACTVLTDVQRRIINTPARAVVGLAIKLRALQELVDPRVPAIKPSDDPSQYGDAEWGIASAVWDAERLAGGGGTATPDPAVELAARYVRVVGEYNAGAGETDEEVGASYKNEMTSLERELMETHPTSREGIVALLDLVLDEYRDEQGAELLWMNRYVIALLENARDAVRGAVGLAGKAPPHASDEKIVSLYQDWRAQLDEHLRLDAATMDMPRAEKRAASAKMEELIAEADMIGWRIIALPATTHSGLATKLKIILNAAGYPADGIAPADWPRHERTVADGLRGTIADLERLA